MIKEEELKQTITKNIIHYRKLNGLTQESLANKLNYSAKAISKWERGESLPDLYILLQLSEIFGITINDLISKDKVEPKINLLRIRYLIAILSFGLTWLIATISFIILKIAAPSLEKSWLAFIYAIPVSVIVLLVFSCIYKRNLYTALFSSILAWSTTLSFCLTFSFNNNWLLFIIMVPLQLLIILWFIFKYFKQKSKKRSID